MKKLYEKQCNGMYLEKYSKKSGNLLRTAEQFDSGCWVVSEYSSKTNMQGEYTNQEFNKIRNRLFGC